MSGNYDAWRIGHTAFRPFRLLPGRSPAAFAAATDLPPAPDTVAP